MSSFGRQSYSLSNISRLGGFTKPFLVRASSFKEKDVSFRVVHKTGRATCLSSPMLPPTLVAAISMDDAPMPAGLASVAFTTTNEKVIHLCAIYRVPNSIRISTPNRSDRVTSGPEGGIALYKGFFKQGCVFHFTLLSSSFWITTGLLLSI